MRLVHRELLRTVSDLTRIAGGEQLRGVLGQVLLRLARNQILQLSDGLNGLIRLLHSLETLHTHQGQQASGDEHE